MAHISYSCLRYFLTILPLLFLLVQNSQAQNGVKTSVFLSPKIEMKPGLVSNKVYLDIDFPRGHIAIKSFDAEVVDEKGNSIPLSQTYVHHWTVAKYFEPKKDSGLNQSNIIVPGNSGICDITLQQHFGLGSETRKTLTRVPDPYGIEAGNPIDIPAGYDEKWFFNIHLIDTRGAEDRFGCIECQCDLYNVTSGRDGLPLPKNYNGGLLCCYDETRCKLKEGFQGMNVTYFLRYTVKYVDWDVSIVPVRIYILDVADIVTKTNGSNGLGYRHDCQVEYEVEPCSIGTVAKDGCIQTNKVSVSLPKGGNLVYGVGHLHLGGLGITLHGEGGRELCTSYPTYGIGHKPGNEAGYVVGMSTCYPSRGSIKISDGETLTVVSKYSSARRHTGVMGLFYFLLADS